MVKEKIRSEVSTITKADGYLTTMSENSIESLREIESFSIDWLYEIFRESCPTLLELLEFAVASNSRSSDEEAALRKSKESRRNSIISTICVLAKTRCDRASGFQKLNSLCLVAKGAKRSMMEILNKQEFCLGHRQTLRHLRDLSKYMVGRVKNYCRSKNWEGYMVIFDNFNISKRVSHQTVDSKNEFFSWVVGLITPIFRKPMIDLPKEGPMQRRSEFMTHSLEMIIPQYEDYEEVLKFALKECALFLSSNSLFPPFQSISQQDVIKHWDTHESIKYRDNSKFGVPPILAGIPVENLPLKTDTLPIGLIDKDENTEMNEVLQT